MRIIKLYEEFNNSDIKDICRKYGIKNFTINEDRSIDVDGDVDFDDMISTVLPLKFNKVNGYFMCQNTQLTSLIGCPNKVLDSFSCGNSKITSLEGCPKEVGGDFTCSYNQLTSFVGFPNSIGRAIFCGNNQIVSFEGFPDNFYGPFFCENNPVHELWKLFLDFQHIELFNDLDIVREDKTIILQRLNEFLDMIGKPKVTEVKGYKCI